MWGRQEGIPDGAQPQGPRLLACLGRRGSPATVHRPAPCPIRRGLLGRAAPGPTAQTTRLLCQTWESGALPRLSSQGRGAADFKGTQFSKSWPRRAKALRCGFQYPPHPAPQKKDNQRNKKQRQTGELDMLPNDTRCDLGLLPQSGDLEPPSLGKENPSEPTTVVHPFLSLSGHGGWAGRGAPHGPPGEHRSGQILW